MGNERYGTAARADGRENEVPRQESSLRDVPWQVWVVVAILSLEGLLGNLPSMFVEPANAFWLLAKCIFVMGLIKRWRWVFVWFLFEGALHAVVFSAFAPGIAMINLAMVVLVASCTRYYFPRPTLAEGNIPRADNVV